MSLPSGVGSVELTVPADVTGSTVELAVVPDFGGIDQILWLATKTPLVDFITTTSSTGTTATITVPATDQAGWVDGSGAAITGWSYIATYTRTVADSTTGRKQLRPRKVRVSPLAAQTTVNLDAVPDANTIADPITAATEYAFPDDVTRAVADEATLRVAGDAAVQAAAAIDATAKANAAQAAAISTAATDATTKVAAVTKTSLGLGNVDNTSDANKPVSTAQAAALLGQSDTPSSDRQAVPAVSDADVTINGTTTAAASMVRQTERNRRLLIIKNLDGTATLNVAEGTLDSTSAPGSGYTSIPVGSEYVTSSARPVFVYSSASSSRARIYTETSS